jgi:LacI family transcriptional regulator
MTLPSTAARRPGVLPAGVFTNQHKKVAPAKDYAEVMAKHRRKSEYITLFEQSRSVAREQFKAYAAAHGCPDGVLCVNDEVALGAYRALCDLEIKVPREVALIGCDGIEDTQYLECPLSTIVQPVEEMCRVAWQMLQERIENPYHKFQHRWPKPQLAVRDSSQFFGGRVK